MTETELRQALEKLWRDEWCYDPIRSELRVTEPALTYGVSNESLRPDAGMRLGFPGGESREYAVEIVADGTPKRVRAEIKNYLESDLRVAAKTELLFALPYLSERVVEVLQRQTREVGSIAAVDASGNYFIVGDGIVAIRLDQKNQYTSSRGIKNIFGGRSSLVSRLLLAKGGEETSKLSALNDAIEALGGSISIATISKVLQRLEDELLVRRGAEKIEVLEPARMLEGLRENYELPQGVTRWNLKLPSERRNEQSVQLQEVLTNWVWAGESCAGEHSSAPPSQPGKVYFTGSIRDRDLLGNWEDDRFYNCVVTQIDDELPFFNSDEENRASELQTYLELSQLGKREREIARGIGEKILERIR